MSVKVYVVEPEVDRQTDREEGSLFGGGAQLRVASNHQQTMSPLSLPLRVAVVQFSPKIGQVEANIARARELCAKLKPNSIDLLCFPEMTFTGYVFDSAEAISPYLEHPQTGPTSQFCRSLADQLGCYVAAGYPERLAADEDHPPILASTTGTSMGKLGIEELAPGVDPETVKPSTQAGSDVKRSGLTVGANSAIIYGPGGNRVVNYRKTNLFETDMTWAKPGTGFASFSLNLPPTPPQPVDGSSGPSEQTTVPVSLGICMDLNPAPREDESGWSLEQGPFEIAEHSIEHNSRILILLNNWLDPDANREDVILEEDEDEGAEERDEDEQPEPAWSTLQYWSARLRPLWVMDKHRRKGSDETIYSDGTASSDGDKPEAEEVQEDKPPHETIVVVCNRTGKENGKTFAGSSAIFSMRAGSGRPKLLDMFGRRDEGIRVWNLLI